MILGATGDLFGPGLPANMALAAPQESAGAAQRLFLEAQRLEADGDLDAALRNYGLLVQQFPQSGLADDALLRLARGSWRNGDLTAAEQALQQLMASYAREPSAAGGFVLEADIRVARARTSADLSDARDALNRVPLLYGTDEYPTLEWRTEAMVRSGEVSLMLGEDNDAASAFLAAIEDEPTSAWTARAQLGLASVLIRSGDWVAAAEVLQRVIDERSGSDGAEADSFVADAARRRLSLVHRMLLRPALGREPWTSARRFRLPGREFKDPVGIAATEEGWLVVVDEGIPIAVVVDPEGDLGPRFPTKEGRMPWWGPRQTTPYVPTKKSVLLPLSNRRETFSIPDGDNMKQLEQIVAGIRGRYGQWFLVDEDRHRVLVFGNEGGYRRALVEGERTEPVDLAQDHLGRIYVLDRRAETVVRFAADGSGARRVVQADWRRPQAIALDELGNVYVLDRDAKQVHVFSPNGAALRTLGPQLPGGIELRSPRDLTVDGGGRLWIADKDLPAVIVLE